MYKSYMDTIFFVSILGELVDKTNLNKNFETCRGEKKIKRGVIRVENLFWPNVVSWEVLEL